MQGGQSSAGVPTKAGALGMGSCFIFEVVSRRLKGEKLL